MAERLLCNFVFAALIAVLIVAMVTSVSAQVPTGTVNGLISDPREAVVPNARVVAISKAQGVSCETFSNADGLYVITDLAPGDYDLKIEASGFAPSEYTEVSVQAGRRADRQRAAPAHQNRPIHLQLQHQLHLFENVGLFQRRPTHQWQCR